MSGIQPPDKKGRPSEMEWGAFKKIYGSHELNKNQGADGLNRVKLRYVMSQMHPISSHQHAYATLDRKHVLRIWKPTDSHCSVNGSRELVFSLLNPPFFQKIGADFQQRNEFRGIHLHDELITQHGERIKIGDDNAVLIGRGQDLDWSKFCPFVCRAVQQWNEKTAARINSRAVVCLVFNSNRTAWDVPTDVVNFHASNVPAYWTTVVPNWGLMIRWADQDPIVRPSPSGGHFNKVKSITFACHPERSSELDPYICNAANERALSTRLVAHLAHYILNTNASVFDKVGAELAHMFDLPNNSAMSMASIESGPTTTGGRRTRKCRASGGGGSYTSNDPPVVPQQPSKNQVEEQSAHIDNADQGSQQINREESPKPREDGRKDAAESGASIATSVAGPPPPVAVQPALPLGSRPAEVKLGNTGVFATSAPHSDGSSTMLRSLAGEMNLSSQLKHQDRADQVKGRRSRNEDGASESVPAQAVVDGPLHKRQRTTNNRTLAMATGGRASDPECDSETSQCDAVKNPHPGRGKVPRPRQMPAPRAESAVGSTQSANAVFEEQGSRVASTCPDSRHADGAAGAPAAQSTAKRAAAVAGPPLPPRESASVPGAAAKYPNASVKALQKHGEEVVKEAAEVRNLLEGMLTKNKEKGLASEACDRQTAEQHQNIWADLYAQAIMMLERAQGEAYRLKEEERAARDRAGQFNIRLSESDSSWLAGDLGHSGDDGMGGAVTDQDEAELIAAATHLDEVRSKDAVLARELAKARRLLQAESAAAQEDGVGPAHGRAHGDDECDLSGSDGCVGICQVAAVRSGMEAAGQPHSFEAGARDSDSDFKLSEFRRLIEDLARHRRLRAEAVVLGRVAAVQGMANEFFSSVRDEITRVLNNPQHGVKCKAVVAAFVQVRKSVRNAIVQVKTAADAAEAAAPG